MRIFGEVYSVELVDPEGETYTLDLYRYKDREVFSPQRIELRAGEEMRFTAGLKDHNGKQVQVNGQRFRVEAVDPRTQTIEIGTKGKRLTMTPEDLLHSDYRWISTVHSLQGATARYAIFSAGQGSGALLSKESWYVAASRASLEFAVYCGDKAQLKESIQSSRAQRPAIDLIHPSIPTPTREQALPATGDYVQQQAIVEALTPQALLALTARLNQIPEATKTVQQVDVASFGYLEQDNQLLMQQLAEAISDYVEQEAFASAILPKLNDLVTKLNTLLADKGYLEQDNQLLTQQLAEAISDYVEQEAFASAILPKLNDLVTKLNTLLADKVPLPSKSLDSKITQQLTRSITNYIEQATVESELTEALENLTKQLTQPQPVGSTSAEQLNMAISNELQQITTRQAVEAVSNYLEHSAVESVLDFQLLETLCNQLSQLGHPDLSAAMQQLEVIVANYQAPKPAGAVEPIAETIADSGSQTALNEVIPPTPPSPSPELLAAQFQILTDQILAPEAVYQDQGLRIERSNGQLTAEVSGTEVDIHKPENLAPIVNHLQALINEFQLFSLYEEFQSAARLEKSILHQATEIVQLNQGNYQSQGLSVEITGSSLEIKLDQELVFKSNQGKVQRPDDLSMMENLELQLTGTIKGLKQIIEAQRQQEEVRLEAERLQAERSATRRVIKPQEKGHGHGLAL